MMEKLYWLKKNSIIKIIILIVKLANEHTGKEVDYLFNDIICLFYFYLSPFLLSSKL
jgi:hypothetical protein